MGYVEDCFKPRTKLRAFVSITLKFQTAFTGCFRQRLDATMEKTSPTVKDDGFHVRCLRPISQCMTYCFRGVHGLT